MNKQREQLREEMLVKVKEWLERPNIEYYHYFPEHLTDFILSLFTKHYLELVGEDEYITGVVRDDNGIYLETIQNIVDEGLKVRNKLRQELRNKMKGDSQDE